MLEVCLTDFANSEIVAAAQFNVGRAYFQGRTFSQLLKSMLLYIGFGVKQETSEAIKWWELCSQSKFQSSVRAMNTLALFYSSPEYFNEEKVSMLGMLLSSQLFILGFCMACESSRKWSHGLNG